MLAVHDPSLRETLHARVDRLAADARPRWGAMSVDQMLWHLNASLGLGLGRVRSVPMKLALPHAILRPVALYLPWPKGKVEAAPEIRADGSYDVAQERVRFHQLVEEFAARPLHIHWLPHPMLGALSGSSWSRLQAKHADHHFRQFGV